MLPGEKKKPSWKYFSFVDQPHMVFTNSELKKKLFFFTPKPWNVSGKAPPKKGSISN